MAYLRSMVSRVRRDLPRQDIRQTHDHTEYCQRRTRTTGEERVELLRTAAVHLLQEVVREVPLRIYNSF